MKRQDINVRDPYVLAHGGKYYLYGSRGAEVWSDSATGFDVYVSEDLENWSEPKAVFTRTPDFKATMNYWAPEVYEYNGAFYMFASFKSPDVCRYTAVLRAEAPDGEFVPWSDGGVTPEDWECLDGTLYITPEGEPYMIFSHEWIQVTDGEMCALKLTPDLRAADGEPFLLFKASEAPWIRAGHADGKEMYITDGPFMYTTKSGTLLMMWSSLGEHGYAQAVSYSSNGRIDGEWIHCEKLLFEKDGGHGMIFKAFDGRLMLTLHAPNENPYERPVFFEIKEQDDTLVIAE